MYLVIVPPSELYDEITEEFINVKGEQFQIEHSLVSLSKWESKWKKPFISKEPKTREETMDYIRCMTVTRNIDDSVYARIPGNILDEIGAYINATMTATWFSEEPNAPKSREIITAEIIYHWMIAFNIPIEFQKWHLDRLLTLIKVCSIKNQPPKKRGKQEMLAQRRALNQSRRAAFNSKG